MVVVDVTGMNVIKLERIPIHMVNLEKIVLVMNYIFVMIVGNVIVSLKKSMIKNKAMIKEMMIDMVMIIME